MRNIEIADEWLYKYMPVVDEALIRGIEQAVDNEHRFSDRFERRMRRLIRKERYLSFRKHAAPIAKRAAVFLIVLLAVAGVLTVSVEALRIKFFDTIKEMFSDYYTLTYSVDGEDTQFHPSRPQYVPDGYEMTYDEGNGNLHTIMYENGDGETYGLNQILVTDNDNAIFDSEYLREEILYVDGIEIEVHWYEDGFSFSYCEFEDCVFQITADSLTKEEIEKIYSGWVEQE
ncbi:MAG TPA: DUF4367 domain-containing protein [Candidatus Mediterraneibacter pullicola]|uniref:DUF4367 domain-containing protein n=1 Tax=Candidatus Mediterraneibacter pullicola TaxID=2838682 RepID=A0A9D2KK44_9FIRM|nr:DUF4367 domain-containing protein [Candidatus Mediterraneibacter pullicola]